ncbi:Uncharacterised protein [Citrobacter braakii]|uniref:hypothetical protein n=1 Tax=Citrobacter TaxID=544 RepID=UPI0006428A50|nr:MULTISPECIES: hypothetical protein [Citrobacter]EGT5655815.1 hypothetical protein [Citrobacter braakii]KLQ21884.1 hypothetical protein ABR34_13820 [Citrobacter braakii]QLV67132.1 hypothetical protein HV237_03920 [Citrobacter sp. RHBSTW-00570]QXA93803.1 hypothetical protein I6L52_04350 [Citrobacter braakii]STB40731.1 Uncharacterised protein [Citrobacter braakii]
MPVDLSAIPDVARRTRQPSIKRWLVIFLIFMVLSGFITSWLWPSNNPSRGAFFWHCFITAPLVVWILLLGTRWLCYLATEWPAEGWDDEREQDIANEIHRGQRFLVLAAQSVHLPHAVTSAGLTQQFMLPQGIVLPSVVDEKTQLVSFQASFSDGGQYVPDKIHQQLSALLRERTLQAAITRQSGRQFTTVVQIDGGDALSEDDSAVIEQWVKALLPASSRVLISPTFGLTDIDNWLDAPESFGTLLILSICIRPIIADGEGEAIVGLLLHFGDNESDVDILSARLHRPEHACDVDFKTSAMQALQWGCTHADKVAWLWLAGLGTENKAQMLLANNNIKFPCVESSQLTDIDMKTGHSGKASPWLAIALAAENTGQSPNPQLILSMPDKEDLPWWLVVHPASESQPHH